MFLHHAHLHHCDMTVAQIAEWREEGKAEIVPGVLFIDEVCEVARLHASWHLSNTCTVACRHGSAM